MTHTVQEARGLSPLSGPTADEELRGRPCPLCGGEGARAVYELGHRSILKCPDCRLLYSSRPFSTEESTSFYDSDEFWEGPLVQGWSRDFDEGSPEVQLFRRALAWLKQEGIQGRLLDVGCSSGLFLELARRASWEPHGVEVSERAVEASRENFSLQVFRGTLEEARFESGHFDAVTLWDVVEHFDDPRAALAEVARITRPGGVLVLCTPNCASLFHKLARLSYRLTLGRVKGILPLLYSEKHNTYFTPATLRAMLGETGFDVLSVQGYSAHPGRWLRERVAWPVRAATRLIDRLSSLLGGRYRMLVFARRRG